MQELPTVDTAQAETPKLVVSVKAAEVFAAGLAERGAKAVRVALEVGVDGSARVRLEMAKEPQQGDVVTVEQGVTFYLDPDTAKEVRGATIEYEDSADGGRFLLGMPHRHGGCGCGGSHGGNSGGSCACGGNHGQGGQAGGHGGGGCACGHEH